MAGILVVLAALMIFNPGLLAQNTAPVSVTFLIARRNVSDLPIDFGLSGMFPSVSMWERTDNLNLFAYTTNRAAGLDSVYFPADSINANKTTEVLYQITVHGRGYGTVTNTTDNGVRSDSTIKISMRRLTQRSDSSANYVVWRKRANRRVIDNLGFTFNSNVKSGQKFEIALTHDRPLELKRDSDDNLNVVTYSPASRLTVKDGGLSTDTLTASAGAIVTDWFAADNANLTVLFKLYTTSADTAAQIALAYQLSWDGITTILPLDEATALNDSATAVDADITGRLGRWNYHTFTHPICKYMRLIIFGKSSVGRVVVDSIDIVTAN